jgi:hypothetical protein
MEVTTEHWPRPLAVVSGIGVAAGEVTSDPRLVIDLRDMLRRIEVRVLDNSGRPIDGGGAVAVDVAGQRELRGSSVQEGIASILVAEPAVDIIAGAVGFATQSIRGVTGDTVIRLEPLPRVTVRIASLQGIPSTFTLSVRLGVRRGRESRSLRSQAGTLEVDGMSRLRQTVDASGAVSFPVAGAGSYSLSLALTNPVGRYTAEIREFEPRRFEITEPIDGQQFEITIPPAELQRVLAEVRGTAPGSARSASGAERSRWPRDRGDWQRPTRPVSLRAQRESAK